MNTREAHQPIHVLPVLPYDYASLEPHIDARTMELHHSAHHASYVENLNAVLAGVPELHGFDAAWLLLHLKTVPRRIRTAVRNNAGGHLNHSMFWCAISAHACDLTSGPLAEAIDRDYGSLERFKSRFENAGTTLFGSGWVWLARERHDGGKLKIYTTRGHDNPIMWGRYPILLNDVWEHAYYLKHESRRDEYMRGWWPIVDWAEAARRFEQTEQSAQRDWEDEGGRVLTDKT